MPAGLALLALLSSLVACVSAITLDVTNAAAVQAAAQASISNLLSLYEPNREGVFPQAPVPWFSSGESLAAAVRTKLMT
jgi:hypothetical protein